jgi:hypothetical protein
MEPISDEQIIAALVVQPTAAGAAAFLSRWHDRTVSAEWVLARVAASERLQRAAKFSAEAHGRSGVMDLDRIRAMARPRRWRERRARK